MLKPGSKKGSEVGGDEDGLSERTLLQLSRVNDLANALLLLISFATKYESLLMPFINIADMPSSTSSTADGAADLRM